MMDDLTIYDAEIADLGRLRALNQANLPHVSPVSAGDWEQMYRQSCYCRLAGGGGKLAGFLLGFGPAADYGSPNFVWFKEHYDRFVYIDRIIVAPAFRNLGIAFRLYRDLEMFSAAKGIPLITCEYNLRPENEESRRFHEKYGFYEVGQQETDQGRKTVSLQLKPVAAPQVDTRTGAI